MLFRVPQRESIKCTRPTKPLHLPSRQPRYKRNYNQYIGHIIRGYHEIKNKNDGYANLPVGEVIEVSDWKMKFIMLLFRETMPDFFGKSGNPWVGTMFIVKVKEGSDLQCFYYDGFMDDKKEDTFGAMSFLEAVQGHFFTVVYPTLFSEEQMRVLARGVFYNVYLDGAGCYIAAENLLTRLAFSCRINVYLKAMFIPEAYYSKTPLDGHFAVGGKQMRAAVAAGSWDAFDASSMFKARVSELTKGEGALNYVIHFEPNRDRQCYVKSTAMQNLKKTSARIPVWIPNTVENRLDLLMQQMLADYTRKTVKQLKEILKERGERTTGLKQVLVQRVMTSEPPPAADHDDDPPLKYLLAGVRLHHHSGMGQGLYYSTSDVRAMWKDKPQISTGVQIVQAATGAGGTSRSASMGGSKKAMKVIHTKSRPAAQKTRGTLSEMKSARLSAEHVAREEKNKKIKSQSKGFWCTKHKKCNRWFASKAGLKAHLRGGECQTGIQMFRKASTKVSVDRNVHRSDHIKRVVADLSGCVTSSTHTATPAVLELYDGVRRDLPGGPYTVPVTAKGYAAKVYRNAANLTPAQREYLEWCFQLGENDKSLKMGPRTTATRMPLHGTTAGFLLYSESRFQKHRPDFWADKGVPTFRVSQCLDHWYIKSWFSSRKQKGDPNELESVVYQGERVWKLTVARLREIAKHLGIDDGNKKELRDRIAKRLSADAGEQFVGKRVKCVVDGEDVLGTIASKSESVERAGHMIYRVQYVNGTENNMYLDEISFTE